MSSKDPDEKSDSCTVDDVCCQRSMDDIYRTLPLDEIPWNSKEPPNALVQLVESGQVRPCRAIDLGCGTGNCTIYLASKGFEMTGVDISPTAVKIARENAEKMGVDCTFLAMDMLGDRMDDGGKEGGASRANDTEAETWEIESGMEDTRRRGMQSVRGVGGGFDFAYDWQVLHHIFPGDRDTYVRNVSSLLAPGGKYLSVCFSERNRNFGGVEAGKIRTTQLNTELYFSSEKELNDLLTRYFSILDLTTIQIPGNPLPHDVVYCFMEKPG